MSSKAASGDTYQPVYQMILQRLGIQVRAVDIQKLEPFLTRRLLQLRLSVSDYLAVLQQNHSTDSGEWQTLARCITNNESFFFRDEGLYALLQTRLLPELLERNCLTKRIKIWSAACSRGEEIYSVAMLLAEMLPSNERWTLQLYGTDIDGEVLETAREGVYSQWSLRLLTPERREKYFQPRQGAHWTLSRDIRSMVRFEHLNLVGDQYPEGRDWMSDIDLIICRNVFIYFASDAIQNTVKKLAKSLRPGGVLVTGHAELDLLASEGLVREMLPGSLVYRRDAGTKTEPVLLVQIELPFKPVRRATPAPPYNIRYKPPVRSPRAEAATVDVKSPESQAGGDLPKLEQALQLFGEARYHEVLSVLDTIVSQSPDIRSNQLKLAAQTWTNLGQYDRAMQVLADALELEPFSAELFYLKAYIEELTGVKDDAIRSLEKAIYLNGEFVPAYIELSSLLALSEREQRARRLRQTALNLLSALPGDTQVSPYAGVRVDELIVFLTQLTDPAKVTL